MGNKVTKEMKICISVLMTNFQVSYTINSIADQLYVLLFNSYTNYTSGHSATCLWASSTYVW